MSSIPPTEFGRGDSQLEGNVQVDAADVVARESNEMLI